jgi:glycosyltransferase involved in cell wall biosynthesis
MMKAKPTKLLIVSNWDWVIYNFRIALARAAREAGYEIVLVCPDGEYVSEFEEAEFRWVEWSLDRRSLNPVGEFGSVLSLARIYEDEQPDLIHHDTIKPNVYGSLATWINQLRGVRDQPPRLINSFMGIGFLFSERLLARILRQFVLPIMRFGMRQDHIVTTFSNREDYSTFVQKNLIESSQGRVMVSEFVNTNRFLPGEEEEEKTRGKNLAEAEGYGEPEPVRVLMAARLLWDKGVQEYVDAAKILASRDVAVEFILAGEPDRETPGFVPEEKLEAWNNIETFRWVGYCSEMPSLLRSCDVAVLPTHYNEGLPRFLVEAAASGLPLVATDLAACQRIVEHRKNGYFIQTQNADDIADAVENLARNPDIRSAMGRRSRQKAEEEFAERKVVKKWLDLYAQQAR